MSGIQDCQKLESVQNANPHIGTEKEKSDIPYGYCQCGCGALTTISNVTRKHYGYTKGQPRKFIQGHHARKRGWAFSTDGYIFIHENGIQILEHRKIVEDLLKKPLPPKTIVHHRDGNPANNSNKNLIVCESHAYHMLMHRKEKAYNVCGHASWMLCCYCKKYDSIINLYVHPGRISRANHKKCHIRYCAKLKERKTNGMPKEKSLQKRKVQSIHPVKTMCLRTVWPHAAFRRSS